MLIEFPKRVCCDWKYASIPKLLIIKTMIITTKMPILYLILELNDWSDFKSSDAQLHVLSSFYYLSSSCPGI
jgi:hypothetical protein